MIVLIFLIFSPVIVNAANCKGLFTQEAFEIITEIINFIKIFVPILLIVLASIDTVNILVKGDPDETKKGSKKIINRFIAAALVFLVPTLVSFLLKLPPVKNALNLVDDPLCGIESGKLKEE